MATWHSTDMEPLVVGFGNLEAEGVVVFLSTSNQNCALLFQGVLDQMDKNKNLETRAMNFLNSGANLRNTPGGV